MREVILRHIYFSRAPCTQCFVPNLTMRRHLDFVVSTKLSGGQQPPSITLSSFLIIPTKIDQDIGPILPASALSLQAVQFHHLVADALVIVPHLLVTTRLFAAKYIIPRLGYTSTIWVRGSSSTILDTCPNLIFDVPLPCSYILSTHAFIQSPMEMSLAAFLECRRQIPRWTVQHVQRLLPIIQAISWRGTCPSPIGIVSAT